jgi:uncharacterized oligopeptide transporter (OPT) family protein
MATTDEPADGPRLTWVAGFANMMSSPYKLIVFSIVTLVAVFMVNRLRFPAVAVLISTPLLLALSIGISLAFSFPVLIGGVLAFFVVRKRSGSALAAT